MADELKDQRVVTMMSPSELEAIDDWMFKNRIRSRGEAIRRLCQVGLAVDEKAEPILSLTMAIMERRTGESKATMKLTQPMDADNSAPGELNLALAINKATMSGLEDHSRLTLALFGLLRPIVAMKDMDEVEAALELAKEARDGLDSVMKDLEHFQKPRQPLE